MWTKLRIITQIYFESICPDRENNNNNNDNDDDDDNNNDNDNKALIWHLVYML